MTATTATSEKGPQHKALKSSVFFAPLWLAIAALMFPSPVLASPSGSEPEGSEAQAFSTQPGSPEVQEAEDIPSTALPDSPDSAESSRDDLPGVREAGEEAVFDSRENGESGAHQATQEADAVETQETALVENEDLIVDVLVTPQDTEVQPSTSPSAEAQLAAEVVAPEAVPVASDTSDSATAGSSKNKDTASLQAEANEDKDTASSQAEASEDSVRAISQAPVVAPSLGSTTPLQEIARFSGIRSGALEVDFHGSYRLLGTRQSNIPLGTNIAGGPSEMLGRQSFIEHRLRAGSSLRWRTLEFELELDVLNGLLNATDGGIIQGAAHPDPNREPLELIDPLRNLNQGIDINSIALRKAYLTWKTGIGNFSFGPTTFTWGTGMLSNDGGARLDDQYGDQRYGDRTVRAMYATRPLYLLSGGRITENLITAIGADFLLQDETGRFRRADAFGGPEFVQDLGVSGIFVLRHQRGHYNSGLFIARRQLWFPRVDTGLQMEGFSTDLGVWAFDFFVEYKRRFDWLKGELYGAFEGVHVTGSTNHVRNLACGGQSDSRCTISQQGAVAKVGVAGDFVGWEILGGYASGDGNPFDENITNFRFDRDFKVGLILFDQVMNWQSAAMVRRAGDPELTNFPAAGLDMLSTSGSVTNALFLQPTVRARLSKHLMFRSSVLWARAPQRYSDALWTNRKSVKTNAFGAPAGHNYGVELDVGLDYRRAIHNHDFIFGIHGGYFAPGNAFEMADGVDGFKRMDSVYLVKARTGFVF